MPADVYLEIAKGNVPGHSILHKFGQGQVTTSLAPITVSNQYMTPTTAVALEIVSDDANDTAAGSGAREVTIIGIDANYDEVIQVIATNGLTAVAIPIDLLRIYRWGVSASGTYGNITTGSHVGILTIRVASAGATWSQITDSPYPAGQSQIGAFTVPDGFRAYLLAQDIDVDSTKSIDVIIFKREGIDVVSAPFTPIKTLVHYIGLTGSKVTSLEIPSNVFPARTDLGYMGKVASGTADVSVHFEILLIKDGY
jgi:hypothetical protein